MDPPYESMTSFQDESHEREYFDFYLTLFSAAGLNKKHILGLKDKHISNTRKFTIKLAANDSQRTRSMIRDDLRVIVEVFLDFSARNMKWDTLDLSVEGPGMYSSFRRSVDSLLRTANKLGLFRRLIFTWNGAQGDVILSGIAQNTRLAALDLHLGGNPMSRNTATTLSDFLQKTQSLEELSLSGGPGPFHSNLCLGLAANCSLLQVSLHLTNAADQQLSRILDSLAENQGLRSLLLHVFGASNFGSASVKSLKNLLRSSSSLRSLSLAAENRYMSESWWKTDLFCQSICASPSLKVLETSSVLRGEFVLTKLFRVLPYCASLEKCHIHEDQINCEDIEMVARMDRLRKPVQLSFRLGPPLTSGIETAIEALLRSHPEIRLKSYHDHRWHRPMLAHLARLNMHGRYLLDNVPSPPVALWPLVLEKVNDKYRWPGQETIRASILYAFLKGPAFASH
eukprot:scaffold1051_cov119-Cylindrotheca_fusiformis.AAC.5